ncbi:M24 family metallopeptidase [Desulfosporosinus sp. BICA1-9]|uniref:M24 family metallopeptidase n=1 Tax=Desulfosporosinus sp. BICA1-9 TaxID=1531958 RepID=UPI00054C73C0|nr:M24 family metallopeptidase [Desulfosporosinus sp. BICA1-9]KJS48360.1 MAG: X-Pro dipeptidase [Peptococcaceae bacterium BRH_c23]KJS86845.1 MAG: X-Pro dipeptidase [Desulfosporosinus sp. BICA1-9]HBW34192.1 ectoine hydrolase DoeA [Desulfosporosinus sp.]
MDRNLYFEVGEYKERLNKTKQSMSDNGIDLIIVTDPANMNYLTGFDGWSFYVHQCLIVIADQDEPIWVGRGQDGNAARLTTWLQEENIRAYTDDYVQSLIKHPMDFVSDIIKEKRCDKRVIATEMDSYYYTAKCQERLVVGLPNATFKDGTNLVNWVRIIKSDFEVEYIRKAARIAENAMAAAYNSINVGVRQCDAAANVYHAQISGTKTYGGDYSSIIPLMPSGIRTSTPHLSWTDGPYVDGESVILELSGCYRRYHCPLSRTMILGDAPQKVRDLAEVVVEGLTNALNAIKPGMTCEEVERVWAKSIAKSGFIKDSRIGYSMGLNYPPDWGEHTASFRPGDKTILKPNMTFHMIPGIWLSDCGVDISESFRVTENGCETFTNYPRKLLVK